MHNTGTVDYTTEPRKPRVRWFAGQLFEIVVSIKIASNTIAGFRACSCLASSSSASMLILKTRGNNIATRARRGLCRWRDHRPRPNGTADLACNHSTNFRDERNPEDDARGVDAMVCDGRF